MSREYTNNTPVLRQLSQNSTNTPTTIVRRQCRQVETIAQKLREEISHQKTVNDDLSYQLEALKQELERKNREIVKQKEMISTLRNENYNSVEKQVYDSLKDDYENMDSELKLLKSHVRTLESVKKEYENDVQSFKDEVAKLSEQLESCNKRTAEMDVVKAERDALVEQCRRFQDKLNISEQLREKEVETLQTVYEEKIQCLQERIDELTENELSMSGDHISPAFDPEPAPESLNIVNEFMYNELAENLDTLKADHEDQIRELRDALSHRSELVSQLNEKIAARDLDLASFANKMEEYESERKSYAALTQEHEKLVGEHHQVQRQVASLEEMKTSFDNRVQSLENDVTKLTAELEVSNKAAAEKLILEKERNELVGLCSELQAKVQVSEQQFHEDIERLLEKHDEEVQSLQTQIEAVTREADSTKNRYDLQISELHDTISQKDSFIAQLQSIGSCEVDELKHDVKHFRELVMKQEQEVRQLREDLQITEQSFEMERAQKRRYQNECMALEKKLDSAKSSNAGNNTYIMPTINIQSGANGQDAAAAAAIVNSLSQSQVANSTFDMGKGRRPLPGTSYFMADEASEVMNTSYISSEDPHDRFATLQQRNRQQPMHLKSCYAAEHQDIAVPENEIRGIPDRQMLVAMARAGPNQTFSVTDTTTHTRTFQVGQAAITSQPMRKPFSPTGRSIFRRVKGSWSPSLKKSLSQIPL